MSNPLIIALKTNPAKFLNDLTSDELEALAQACVRVMERRGRDDGDKEAISGLHALYRALGEIEV